MAERAARELLLNSDIVKRPQDGFKPAWAFELPGRPALPLAASPDACGAKIARGKWQGEYSSSASGGP